MELFFSRDIDGKICRLDQDESTHCVKVLRHREGDEIHVIDGEGTLYNCRLLDASPKGAEAEVISIEPDWGAHPYFLQMAVCPTKNLDRFEWFAEKATELGVDVITPTIGDHSERKVFKTDRLKRILLSATKQSLKGAVPQVDEAVSLSDFIRSFADVPAGVIPLQNVGCADPTFEGALPPTIPRGLSAFPCLQANTRPGRSADADFAPLQENTIKLIACCYEGEEKRISIDDALSGFSGIDSSGIRIGGPGTGNSATLGLEGGPRSGGAERSEAFHVPGTADPVEQNKPKIVILIGPEGDFSRDEVELALKCGFKPVHLGPSRLRTETAALTAVAAVYFHWCHLTDCYTDD